MDLTVCLRYSMIESSHINDEQDTIASKRLDWEDLRISTTKQIKKSSDINDEAFIACGSLLKPFFRYRTPTSTLPFLFNHPTNY